MKRTLGVCYYPEQWPESQWEDDARRMAEIGLTWVRIGEFAWSRIEPEPGRFDWDWLDRAIATLGRHGLRVVLGTPTATPPIWVLEKLPDMLAVDEFGRSRGFGSRRHYDFSHQGYRQESARIVTAVAQRYGRNPHIGAWQTDNEYACHDTVLSYSPAALKGFRDWLASKYQSPQALNRAWGNVFWSMEYSSFDQVGLPNLTVTEANPAHWMDFRRYSSDMVVEFNRIQTEILRKYSDAPIAHNYMGKITEFDHFAVGADLEIASWDAYPLGHLAVFGTSDAVKRDYVRQGDPDFQAFHHDLYRAVGAMRPRRSAAQGRWWVMEQQPGPVNWAPYNPDPLPGMARLWAWEAFAHGAEAVCYFRWRQAPFAQEQMHAGLLRPDDKPAPAYAEAAQVACELAEMPEQGTTRAKVALVFDYASAWAWKVQPQGKGFDYVALALHLYRGLRLLGLSVDILPPDADDLSGYRLVLAPGVATLSDPLKAAMARFDGHILLGPRTNSKTPDFATPVPLPPAIPGLDAVIARVESLPPEVTVPVDGGGSFSIWREKLETAAKVVIDGSDGFPALVQSEAIHYLAGWPDDVLRDRVLAHVSQLAGLPTTALPEGLRCRETETHRFWFNYGAQPVAFQGMTIPAAGVHWEKL